jgi:hypothetical protein
MVVRPRRAAPASIGLTALYAERDENTQRDDFSPSEMVVHARRIESLEKELAKQRQQQAGRDHGRGQIASAESAEAMEPPPRHQRETRNRVANAVGTSHDTLAKARHVIDTAEDAEDPDFSPSEMWWSTCQTKKRQGTCRPTTTFCRIF